MAYIGWADAAYQSEVAARVPPRGWRVRPISIDARQWLAEFQFPGPRVAHRRLSIS